MGIKIGIGRMQISHGGGTGVDWSSYWTQLISAVVENAAPTDVVMTFPSATSTVATDITCNVNGVARAVSSASWTGAVWTVVLTSAVDYGDVVVMTFAKTGQTTAVTNNIIPFEFPVVTTGAATLTLNLIDVVTGKAIKIYWGDGNSDTYTNKAVARTHNYAGAGTYTVRIAYPQNIEQIDLRDSKITSFNTEALLSCGDNLASLGLYNTLTSPIIDSVDLAHLRLSSTLFLLFTQAGTYSINSSHFAAYTLSTQLYLYFNTSSLTKTIAAVDFDGFIRVPTVQIEMGLTATEVSNILLGFYGALASKTNTGGTIGLAGNGNAAPTGTYQAQVPPTTGKEAAYELLNDSGGITAKEWATITVQGGLP